MKPLVMALLLSWGPMAVAGPLVPWSGDCAKSQLVSSQAAPDSHGSWVLGAAGGPTRRSTAMTYDVARGRTVLFGGGDVNGYRDDQTWFLDGNGWSMAPPPPSALQPRWLHAMVYDSARQRVVLYGGVGCTTGTETWEHDGTGWAPGPPAPPGLGCRELTGLSFDTARASTVLFGGLLGNTAQADTWEYDGVSWTASAAVGPPRRSYHAMAYDPGRGVTVLVGGWDDPAYLNDTWEYDGTSWTAGIAFPWGLAGSMMVYAPNEAALAHIGGSMGFCAASDLLHFYDGAAWTAAQSLPTAIWLGGISFDVLRDRMVVFGGLDEGGATMGATWEYTDCRIQVSPPTLPQGTAGSPYAAQLSATGGTPPYQFALFSGSFPPGLTLSGSGLISGTPTARGTFYFQVAVTGGCTQLASYSIEVRCGSIALSPSSLPPGRVSVPYSQTFTATGGLPPYTFSSSGTLPPGLSLKPAGILSGTPMAAGVFPVTIQARDAASCIRNVPYTLAIQVAPAGIAAGLGHGQPNANRVRLFLPSGLPTPFDLAAYAAGAWGTNVAGDSVDPIDETKEVLTGPGPGPSLGPQVKAFRTDGRPIAKINFFAYGTLKYGVNVATSDLDYGPPAEILTGAGPGDVFGPHVRCFEFDGNSTLPLPGLSFFAYGTLKYGVNPAGGNVDGIGIDEILTAPGAGPPFGPHVRGFSFVTGVVTAIPQIGFFSGTTVAYGAVVAGGDVDDDGFDEIVATPGPDPAGASRFLGYDYDNASIRWIQGFNVTPFSTLFGGRVALADTEGNEREELLAAPGPAPAASADVRVYAFAGFGLTLLQSFPAFPAGYGATVGASPLVP